MPSMQLPFTPEQFDGGLRAYNTTVWPAQILLVALALAAIVCVFVPHPWSGMSVSAILAALWAWLGLAYHLTFFTRVNPAAYGFAALSVIGALIFLWQGVIRRRLSFAVHLDMRMAIGLLLVVFALVIYPAWCVSAGRHYPSLPTFGLPCPTTIFTIGVLATMVRPYPRSPLVVPVLWSLVGGQAALLLDVPPDLGLVVAGGVGAVLIARSKQSNHGLRTGGRPSVPV